MKLLTSNTSPFVRKVRIAVLEKGLSAVVAEIHVQPQELFGPALPAHIAAANPLGKIPALIRDDGSSLFDSSVIVEFLDSLTPAPQLLPAGEARWAAKRWEAVADGLLDAAVQVRLETVLRPPEMQYAPDMNRQLAKVDRALELLEAEAPHFAADWHIGSIAIASALAWLDLRFASFGWRDRNPALVTFEASAAAHSSYTQTAFVV